MTPEQCNEIKLSKSPVTILSLAKSINSVIDERTMGKLTTTRISQWLLRRGYLKTNKVRTVVNRTVYDFTEGAGKIGTTKEEVVDKRSGEVRAQIRFSECGQLFVIENLADIVAETR